MTRSIRFTPFVRGGVFAAALGAAALAQAAEVPFAPPLPVYTPAGPVERWAPADIDGDADLDLLVAAPAEGRLLLLRNLDGAGASWAAVTVATSAPGPTDTVAGDVDGDGDLDALSVSFSSTVLEWHENLDAAGTAWTTHTIAPGGSFGLEVADIDRDGDLDVVALPDLAGSPLRWYRNGGGGASWTPHTIGTVGVIEAGIDAVDIDGDGDLDLLTTFAGAVLWFENSNGGTSWSLHPTGIVAANGFAAADIDRDGDPDVVAQFHWYENDPRGSWTPHLYATTAPFASSLPTPADVDSDGDVDIWAHESASSGAIVWYENLMGDGLDWVRRVIATATSPTSATPVDLDGDGDLDGLSASGVAPARIVRHRNDTLHRNACFAPPQTLFTFAEAPDFIVSADLDGDGDQDVITTHDVSSRIFWHENAASASTWTTHTLSTARVFGPALNVGDVDRDGDVDVVGDFSPPGPPLRKAWLENAGDGLAFTPHTISTFNNFYGAQIHVADVDGDGDLDVVESTGTGYGNFSRWYPNATGDGSAWSAGIPVPGDRGQLADFDRDGDLDIVAGVDFNIELFWLENTNGAGTSWQHRLISQPFDARPSAAADIDGDGHVDVINNAGITEWYRNLGSGAMWSGAGQVPDARGRAFPFDLDTDGDLDLLGFTSSSTYGWQENLQGTGAPWRSHTLPGGVGAWTTAADLDRDGDLDVVTGPGALLRHDNRGGQYALEATNQAPGTIQQGNQVSMLRVVASHLGRAGDGALELARFGVLLEESAGDPLTTAEANLLVESLRVYRDANGNGVFDQATDVLVTSVDTLSLAAGIQDVPFTDGDANVTVSVGTPRTYFVVVQLSADASTQNPNRLRATLLQLGPSASQAEHAAYDLPIVPACPADVSSGVVVATIPVELMRFSIE